MNMLCLGWRTMTTCGGAENSYGRSQVIVPPVTAGCSAAWFYIGLAVVAGIAVVNK